jgi:hypothetical protein
MFYFKAKGIERMVAIVISTILSSKEVVNDCRLFGLTIRSDGKASFIRLKITICQITCHDARRLQQIVSAA